MNKKPVIASTNTATTLPIWKTLIVVLLLLECNAPVWLWIMAIVILFVAWLICSINISNEVEVEVFPGQDEAEAPTTFEDYYGHNDPTMRLHENSPYL